MIFQEENLNEPDGQSVFWRLSLVTRYFHEVIFAWNFE